MANPNKEKSITADAVGNPLLGTQQTNVADNSALSTGVVAVTYTANDPATSPNQAVTFADGSALAAAEVFEFVDEVEAALSVLQTGVNANVSKINAILDVLEAHGLMADS